MESNKRILCVGLCCFDHISLVNEYPEEDSDQRCICIWKQRGGNASTNTTILSLLNSPCDFMGTIGSSEDTEFLLNDFAHYGIGTENCVIYDCHGVNTALIILNKQNGSRTILYHQTTLPELNCNDFLKVDLSKYKWIHFEGRSNVENVCDMIEVVRNWNETQPLNRIKISIEIEKPKENFKQYLDKADYIFLSKDFAKMMKCNNMEETVVNLSDQVKNGALVVCAWAENGAAAKLSGKSTVYKSPAFIPPQVVNTLGAGDIFNGTLIHKLSKGDHIENALTFACKVAGAKCGLLKNSELETLIDKIFVES